MISSYIKTISNILIAVFCACLILTSCYKTQRSKDDPFEPYNRAMYKFNKTVDKFVMRPVAKTYETITPYPLRRGVSNVFDNLYQPTSVANNIFQGQILYAVSDLWRFIINSTIGFGGFFDIATFMGLEKNPQDFGLTLGKWGDKNSVFLVLPLLGPSTVRDTAGFVVDNTFLSLYPYIRPIPLRTGLYIGRVINRRANLLDADKLIEEALDPYVAERDAYMQFRKSKILGQDHNDIGQDIFDEEKVPLQE